MALVSGASQGLGKAVAMALSREGARVALCSRDKGRAAEAARDISGRTGREVLSDAVDVAEARACRRWVGRVLKVWGRLDILVHNEGGPPAGSFGEVSEKDWDSGFQTSFKSALSLCRLAIPAMKKGRWGRIVFIASTSAKQPIAGLAISNALRAGILGLSKTLSAELGPHNILVNAVLPGYTRTERLAHLARVSAAREGVSVKRLYERWAAGIPLRRLANPEEIAAAAAFLCSEPASFVTGVALQVDGGRVASPF